MDTNNEVLDRLWCVNVKAPLNLICLCLPHLQLVGSGWIINISSLSGKRVRNFFVGYNTTKFALMEMSHTTHYVMWEKEVRVMTICPSFVQTYLRRYVLVTLNLLTSYYIFTVDRQFSLPCFYNATNNFLLCALH